jgi:hypothetical protein
MADLPTVNALAWTAGRWHGSIGEDVIEEHWSSPEGGTLMGMFRWLKDGKVYLYEFMTFEPYDDSLMLRIKHFNAGLVGWEEKDTSTLYYLDRMEPRSITLDQRRDESNSRISYRLDDADTMVVTLERSGAEGATTTLEFHYTRMPG